MQQRKNKRPSLTIKDLDNAPQKLPSGQNQNVQSNTKTVLDNLHDAGLENFKLKLENIDLKQQLKTKKILDKLIEPTARKTFRFMIVYS